MLMYAYKRGTSLLNFIKKPLIALAKWLANFPVVAKRINEMSNSPAIVLSSTETSTAPAERAYWNTQSGFSTEKIIRKDPRLAGSK